MRARTLVVPTGMRAIVALVPTSAAAAWWATPSPPMAATTSAPEAMALRTVASTPPAADGQSWSTSYRLRRMPVTRRRASPLKPDAAGLARMASLTRSAPRWPQPSRPGRGAGALLGARSGDQHVHRQQTEGGETPHPRTSTTSAHNSGPRMVAKRPTVP